MSLREPPAVIERRMLASCSKPMAPASNHHARIDSKVLLRGARELLIGHGDEVYRLRHTRNDKLILTK